MGDLNFITDALHGIGTTDGMEAPGDLGRWLDGMHRDHRKFVLPLVSMVPVPAFIISRIRW